MNMKTCNEIRMANAQTLIDEKMNGRYKDFANKIGTEPAYISQIYSDKTNKNYGDALARKTEKAFGLEVGWLDNIHEKDPLKTELFTTTLSDVIERDRQLGENKPVNELVDIALAAYDFLKEGQENDIIAALFKTSGGKQLNSAD